MQEPFPFRLHAPLLTPCGLASIPDTQHHTIVPSYFPALIQMTQPTLFYRNAAASTPDTQHHTMIHPFLF